MDPLHPHRSATAIKPNVTDRSVISLEGVPSQSWRDINIYA